MKFLTFALMPTKKGQGLFSLADMLRASYENQASKLNDDGYLFYQAFILNTIEEAYEFLKTLHIENEDEVLEQDQLGEAQLNHVVLSVPDEFDHALPLNDIVSEIFILLPGHYINQELNDAMDQNDRTLKTLREQQKAIGAGVEVAKDDQVRLWKDYAAALAEQRDLEVRWKAFTARPFQVLKGPQFDAGTALTPILFHAAVNNDASPVLQRQVANAHLNPFNIFTENRDAGQNDNNFTPDQSPVMRRKH